MADCGKWVHPGAAKPNDDCGREGDANYTAWDDGRGARMEGGEGERERCSRMEGRERGRERGRETPFLSSLSLLKRRAS